MTRGLVAGGLAVAVVLGATPGAPAGNTDPLDAARDLAGKTLSGVAYLPQATPQLGAAGTPSLKTVMFQAYLAPDGSAQVRAWDPVANRYTATDTRPWRGEGDTLCLTVPAFALPDALCVALHAWGPAFAGTGVNHNAMVKGDIQPGAALR
jgi:hypothetical protein